MNETHPPRLILTPQERGARLLPQQKRYAPQQPYKFQAYPSQRYHPDGRITRVENVEEDRALGEPWRDAPYPPPPPPPPPVPEATPAELKAAHQKLAAEHRTLDEDHRKAMEYCAEKVAEILDLRQQLVAAEDALRAADERIAELETAAEAPAPETPASETAGSAGPATTADLAPATDLPLLSRSESKRQKILRGK